MEGMEKSGHKIFYPSKITCARMFSDKSKKVGEVNCILVVPTLIPVSENPLKISQMLELVFVLTIVYSLLASEHQSTAI